MTVHSLADRAAITDLLHRYCRAVDRLDVPLGHSIWNEGSHADYGADFYQGPGPGVIDRICRDHAGTLGHHHQLGNILIDLDGERAGSESYCTAHLRIAAGEGVRQIMVLTRYVDAWSSRDGRWGLDRRIAIREWGEIREITSMPQGDLGRRDRTDPSYLLLRDPT